MDRDNNTPAYQKVLQIPADGNIVLVRRLDDGTIERRDVDADWCIIDDFEPSLSDLRNLIENAREEGAEITDYGEELADESPKLPMGMPSKYYPASR